MAALSLTLQGSTPSSLCRGGKVRFFVGECVNPERVTVSTHGRDFKFTIALPHHVVCSTASRSRDSVSRRNSRSPNRKQGGSSTSKPVSVLPGDMKLLLELQEFISLADLPPHQVPSTRELARRGRQDLANAVRRRGNKAVSQLLANPNFLNSSITTKHSKLTPGEEPIHSCSKAHYPCNLCRGYRHHPQVRRGGTPTGISKAELILNPGIHPQVVSNSHRTTDLVPENGTGILVPHYETVAKRQLDPYQHKDHPSLDDVIEATRSGSSRSNDGKIKSKQGFPRTLDLAKLSKEADAFEEGDTDDEDNNELYADEDSNEDEDDQLTRLNPTSGLQESREGEAWQKSSLLRSKLQTFFDNPIDKGMARPRRDLGVIFDIMAKQRESERVLQDEKHDKELLSASRAGPATELARLSALVHTKNMENLRVSRELEETKALLALVRARHGAELAQAKQVAVERDLRLQAAEQALRSLKRVQVDWWGEGTRVELAGSFNSWEHPTCMLPDLSSKVSQLGRSRGPMIWRVELWLYPGVYEIKFIVDGNWVIDHRREIVQRHMGQNNLLYVEL